MPSTTSRCFGLLILLAALATCLSAASPTTASAANRANLTWDTDDTDVDLHVWDEYGNHAWYGEREGIPLAELSTDIQFGYGPEDFEEFEGSEDYDYSYGICYFASNRDDDVVPETVATVELTDPGGQKRTIRRRLRQESEAFYIGNSPENGPDLRPASDDWCRGGDGPVHDVSDDGGLEQAGSFDPCSRVRRRVGTVEVCANAISGGGPRYTLNGNVRLNGSVTLGDGPVVIDVDAKRIEAPAGTRVAVARPEGPVGIVTGKVDIDAKGVKEEVSGRDGVAALDVSSPQLDALKLAGLGLKLAQQPNGGVRLFLDARDGGGVIGTAKLALPLGGETLTDQALAVGVHAKSARAIRPLGGTAGFGRVGLPGTGWEIRGLQLSYAEANNTWTAKGGFMTPAFGLDVDAQLADGRLDSLGVAVSKDVPIGTTGFILSRLGGRIDGLVTPPLKLSATASGRWGSVPALNAGLILLKDVTLTLDLSGRISLSGGVSFVLDNGPVKGRIELTSALSPFEASGSLQTDINLFLVQASGRNSLAMNAQHFTALGSTSAKLRGLSASGARSVLSDAGLGVSGEVSVFGRKATLGAGMAWKDFPRPQWIGSDIERFVTRRARAAATRGGSFDVEAGRPLLFVDASSPAGPPDFRLREPGGRTYSTTRDGSRITVLRDPATGTTALTVLAPKAGRWTVLPGRGAAPQFQVQTIRDVSRVRGRVRTRSSQRKPLARTGGGILVRWSSRGLGPRARVDVYAAQAKGQLGRLLVAGKRARGSARIARRLLAPGANHLHLVVSDSGRPIDDVPIAAPVWMR